MGVTHSSHKLQPEDILSIQMETGFTSSQIDRLYTRFMFYSLKSVREKLSRIEFDIDRW